MKNKYPNAMPQDTLIEIFPHVYLLRGSLKVAPLLQINRNMLVIEQQGELTLINAVRMNENNLKHLEQIGTVKHVIRLGDFHGMDDQFYLDHYDAKLWSQDKHVTYPNLIPQQIISEDIAPPIANSQFFVFQHAKRPEAILFLQDKQLLITTDSIQYWNDWKYFTFLSKIIMYLMGFRLKLFIGGPWLKQVSEHKNSLKPDFERLLSLDFHHLVASHGNVLKHSAKTELQDVIQHTFLE